MQQRPIENLACLHVGNTTSNAPDQPRASHRYWRHSTALIIALALIVLLLPSIPLWKLYLRDRPATPEQAYVLDRFGQDIFEAARAYDPASPKEQRAAAFEQTAIRFGEDHVTEVHSPPINRNDILRLLGDPDVYRPDYHGTHYAYIYRSVAYNERWVFVVDIDAAGVVRGFGCNSLANVQETLDCPAYIHGASLQSQILSN